MRRQWIWFGSVSAAALAIAFAGWFPYYRLEREVAAARAEGLWTELTDIPKAIVKTAPKGENAAPLILETIAESRAKGFRYANVSDDADKILKRTASTAEKDRLRNAIQAHPGIFEKWQKASGYPRLDYGRDWTQGYAVLFPELADLKLASKMLAAAAALDIEPKENLLAAARLSSLVRQEPSTISHLVSVAMGRIALREAKRQGLSTAVEKALGSPIDVRWTYAGELPCALDTMRRVGSTEWFKSMGTQDSRDVLERLRNTGPWKANAAYRLVRDYRALWREMPKNPKDYDAAIRAIDRWIPKAYAEMSDASSIMSKLMGGPSDVSESVKAFKRFEAERQAARKKM